MDPFISGAVLQQAKDEVLAVLRALHALDPVRAELVLRRDSVRCSRAPLESRLLADALSSLGLQRTQTRFDLAFVSELRPLSFTPETHAFAVPLGAEEHAPEHVGATFHVRGGPMQEGTTSGPPELRLYELLPRRWYGFSVKAGELVVLLAEIR